MLTFECNGAEALFRIERPSNFRSVIEADDLNAAGEFGAHDRVIVATPQDVAERIAGRVAAVALDLDDAAVLVDFADVDAGLEGNDHVERGRPVSALIACENDRQHRAARVVTRSSEEPLTAFKTRNLERQYTDIDERARSGHHSVGLRWDLERALHQRRSARHHVHERRGARFWPAEIEHACHVAAPAGVDVVLVVVGAPLHARRQHQVLCQS